MNINSPDNSLLRFYKAGNQQNLPSLPARPTEPNKLQQDLPEMSSLISQLSTSTTLQSNVIGKTYEGNINNLIVVSPEMSEKIDSILNRVGEESQKQLIDSGLMTDEQFLEMASGLGDEQVSQLALSLQGLATNSALSFHMLREPEEVPPKEMFINVLQEADDATRSNILNQAAGYADKVSPPAEDDLYTSYGQLNQSSSADDLYSFISALGQTDDANKLIDDLNQFDPKQQNQLLNVMGMDYESGIRLLNQISDKSENIQDKILGFLGNIAATSSMDYHSPPSPAQKDLYVLPGHDNFFSDISQGMIEDTINLMETYDFSDEQLLQMGNDLNNMERSDQRVYLAMTQTGLEQLLSGKTEPGIPPSSKMLKQAMHTVSEARSDPDTREQVFRARYGEKNPDIDSDFLNYKHKREANKAMQSAIIDYFSDLKANKMK